MANIGMVIDLLETFRDRDMWIEGFMTHEDKPKTRKDICGYAIETIKEQQAEIEQLKKQDESKVVYGKTVEEYEKDIIELAATACMNLVPEEYEAMMKHLTLAFRDPTNEEADSFPVEIKDGKKE